MRATLVLLCAFIIVGSLSSQSCFGQCEYTCQGRSGSPDCGSGTVVTDGCPPNDFGCSDGSVGLCKTSGIGCFADGQLVLTQSGPRSIESLYTGDRVFDGKAFSQVTWIMQHREPKPILSIKLSDEQGSSHFLTLSLCLSLSFSIPLVFSPILRPLLILSPCS